MARAKKAFERKKMYQREVGLIAHLLMRSSSKPEFATAPIRVGRGRSRKVAPACLTNQPVEPVA